MQKGILRIFRSEAIEKSTGCWCPRIRAEMELDRGKIELNYVPCKDFHSVFEAKVESHSIRFQLMPMLTRLCVGILPGDRFHELFPFELFHFLKKALSEGKVELELDEETEKAEKEYGGYIGYVNFDELQ
jgi:hypothetical protein